MFFGILNYVEAKFFLFFFLLFLPQAFSLSVDLSIEIQKTETTLNYIVSFGENESVSSLAIEMPQNASVENVLGNRGEVPYEEAGDFIILRPDAKENGKTYLVKIISEDTSLQIYEKKPSRCIPASTQKLIIIPFELHYGTTSEKLSLFSQGHTR